MIEGATWRRWVFYNIPLILFIVGQPLSDPVVLAGRAAAGAIYNGVLAIATYPIARSMRHVTEKQASFGL